MNRSPRRSLTTLAVCAVTAVPLALLPIGSAAATTAAAAAPSGVSASKVAVHRVGASTRLVSASTGGGELRPPGADSVAEVGRAVQNRSPHSQSRATRGTPPPSGIAPTQTLGVTNASSGFQGINHYDQRTTDGGNQWSLVPPDQGLCAGDGQVVEAVNNAIRVYSTAGAALSDVVSNNQFFWHDHEIIRATGIASIHQVGDPSCVYDAGSDRFFYTVYDGVSDTAGNPTGPSFIDIAVSPVGTALGAWSIYQLDTTDDGTDGTPSHPNCPCFADYPHLGTDANALYITTNEYPTFGAGYDGANVYAIDKQALAAGTATIPSAMFNTARTDLNQGVLYDGFTLAPALSAGTAYAPNTMYFLSSDSFSGDVPIVSHQVLLWSITNTSQISTNPAALHLTHTAVGTNGYYPPPASDQKAGSVPLAACLNVTACAKAVLGTPDKFKEYEFAFDSSDTRMLQSAYVNGKVWGALDTAVDIGPVTKAGVAYYVVDAASATLAKQGTLAVPNENITYPTLGVTATGHAVMAMTLAGPDYYPSAAYLTLDDQVGTTASPVTVVGAGAGPDDDFSGYRGFLYNRPRWGDYGAAAVVGGTVWIASEYIAQTCSLAQFEAAPFGTCGNTRTVLANWSTHIASVTVG
ncbi:MAG: hypothetical protein QOG80_3185 [Pseudonocardiales bacterium]|nr:hypothetical protein [Pseudonocardiales bacterium]